MTIGFLFIRNEGSTPKTTPEAPAAPAPPKAKADSETTPSTSLQGDASTPQAYFETLKKLGERFLQRDQFIAACEGRHVVWRGYVRNVTSHSTFIYVTIDVELDPASNTFYANCPKSLETQLFSFRKGDHVEVTGTLNISVRVMPDIKSSSVHLVI